MRCYSYICVYLSYFRESRIDDIIRFRKHSEIYNVGVSSTFYVKQIWSLLSKFTSSSKIKGRNFYTSQSQFNQFIIDIRGNAMRILRCLTNQRFKLLYEKEQRKSAFRVKYSQTK